MNASRSGMLDKTIFEAAACGTAIVSDRWTGIDSVLVPGSEIVIADSTQDVLDVLRGMGEDERLRMAERARARILADHTAAHRALELESHARELLGEREPEELQRWA